MTPEPELLSKGEEGKESFKYGNIRASTKRASCNNGREIVHCATREEERSSQKVPMFGQCAEPSVSPTVPHREGERHILSRKEIYGYYIGKERVTSD